MTKKNKENFINFFGGKNKDNKQNDDKKQNDDNNQTGKNKKNGKNGKICNLTGDIKERRK